MRAVLRTLALLALLLVTGLGVWLASALVSLAGGPAELACVGGLLLFPVLPVWWEKRATDAWHARLRRATRLLPKKRPLTAFTRVALRTVAVNVAFVAALLGLWPQVAFTALVTRGDWFLDGETGPWAERGRTVLVGAATGLEWLHRAANDNPYRTASDEATPVPDDVQPVVAEVTTVHGSGARWRRPDPQPTQEPVAPTPDPTREPPPTPDPAEAPTRDGEGGLAALGRPPLPEDTAWTVGQTRWPWPDSVHPVVAGMTAGDETSPEAVARYIASRVTDPFERVKALHDWVVTRLRYDQAALTGRRPPQDARSVFDARTGVCEGYARLLVELGQHTGDRILYVTGEVREEHGELAAVGHAWNAVEVKGAWYLLDATWDDPVVPDGRDMYRTDYLFIPPKLAALNHFPDEPRLQLLAEPLSRAAFLRQPLATPGLAKHHLELEQPGSAVVEVRDTFELELKNPARRHVLVAVQPGDAKCGPSDDETVKLSCPVPSGAKEAVVFVNHQREGSYGSVASFKLR